MLALYRCRPPDGGARALLRRLGAGSTTSSGSSPGRSCASSSGGSCEQDPELELAASATGAAGRAPGAAEPARRPRARARALREMLARARVAPARPHRGRRQRQDAARARGGASRRPSSYANGAALVELAPLRDPELVVPTIAHGARRRRAPGQTARAARGGARDRASCCSCSTTPSTCARRRPRFVELLARAPRLTMLVTSRAVLHLSGEHVFPVAPLDEDDARRALRAARALARARRSRDHAGQRRGRARDLPARRRPAARDRARRGADPGARRRSAVLERLDGAAQLPRRAARATSRRASRRCSETLDWSYDLLSRGGARRLLARLSVFPAARRSRPSRRSASTATTSGALDLVERLADASCSFGARTATASATDMLETVRQYAAERLEGARARAEPRRRHAEWCLALAERAEPELSGEHQTRWFAILEAEHDNAAGGARPPVRGGRRRARAAADRRAEPVLVRPRPPRRGAAPPRGGARRGDGRATRSLLRRAHTAGASIALLQGDYAAATAIRGGALASARRAGEPRFVANALSNLGAIVLAAGDDERAAVVLEEAVDARPRGRRRADRRARAQQPRRPRALDGRLRARASRSSRRASSSCARAATRRTSRARCSTSAQSR